MGPGDAIASCFGKYIEVRGRASRMEFWWFVGFLVMGSTAVALLDGQLIRWVFPERPYVTGIRRDGFLSFLFCLLVAPPTLAVAWRRMHDTGRSGFELFLPLIMATGLAIFTIFAGILVARLGSVTMLRFLGHVAITGCALVPIVLLWWLVQPGEPFTNSYGPQPEELDR
ncbi:MAG: DUF805 domain-containing protein [Pseudomonadota bacterium]